MKSHASHFSQILIPHLKIGIINSTLHISQMYRINNFIKDVCKGVSKIIKYKQKGMKRMGQILRHKHDSMTLKT
jgi:hypothetical protein